jgi:hypothetical protein
MKTNFIRTSFILIIVFTLGLTTAVAQKRATVHGQIVELISYLRDGLKPTSPSKKEVAMGNFKKGGALAIIDNSNKLYLIVPGSADTSFVKNVTPYLGVKSFVKGPVFTRSGVRLIVLEDIGKSLK